MTGTIEESLAPTGLAVLGACPAHPDDALPDLPGGRPPASLVLVGNAGSGFWPQFAASKEYSDAQPDPLNRWSAQVLTDVANALQCGVVFPFAGPPYYPFQQWALRAGGVSQSPLGVLAQRRWGLWFAYRGALLFDKVVDLEESDPEGPCETCEDKPCLAACPVDAFAADRPYDAELCRGHVSGAGARTCGSLGCQVRHACPFGRDFAYRPEQAAFHMRAFVGA